jgi:hypothetical protein
MPGPVACRLHSQQNPIYEQALSELGAACDLELGALSHCVAQAAAGQLRSQVDARQVWQGRACDEVFSTTLLQARSCCLAELHALCNPEAPQIEALLSNELYLERLSHLALETLLVHRAAPPLLHFPHPAPGREGTLTGGTVVGVLFDFPLGITHELFPLWTDAFAFGLEAGNPLEVAGIHISWLNTDLRATRAITFDARRDVFMEAPTECPLLFHGAVLINQSRETHSALSQRLQEKSIPHVNPSSLAHLADDKWACYQRWQEAGIPTPETVLLPADSPDTVQETTPQITAACAREGSARQWVVQPRHGTEGRDVNLIQHGPSAPAHLLRAWRRIAANDDAILRPRVGNLEWRRDPGGDWHPLELRLHVGCDGETWAAESGYVARSRLEHTSIDWLAPPLGDLERLELAVTGASPSKRRRIRFDGDDLRQLGRIAEDAVRALGPMPLSGVDLALTWRETAIEASILDVNPRPAGLMRANLLADPGAAGIGYGLWGYLSDQIDSCHPQ